MAQLEHSVKLMILLDTLNILSLGVLNVILAQLAIHVQVQVLYLKYAQLAPTLVWDLMYV